MPIELFSRGSTYTARVKHITSSSTFDTAAARVFIDYNHDGLFNLQTESVFLGKTTNAGAGSITSASVLIPPTALTGITGLRVFVEEGSTPNTSCGNFYNGEMEDYLIYIDFANNEETIKQPLDFSIYPNPVQDIAILEYSGLNPSSCKMRITDITGKMINEFNLEGNPNSFTFSTEKLATGFYFVEVLNKAQIVGKIKLCVLR